MKQRFLTVAMYRFVELPDFELLRAPLLAVCEANRIKGTLLLAPEGINGTVAADPQGISGLLDWLRADPRFAPMEVKQSWADTAPFLRLKVRLKAEIVSMHVPGINPTTMAGHYVDPQDWNQLIDDPDVVVVDARNDYEVAIGSFAGAHNPHTRSFSELPAWVARQAQPDGVLAKRGGRKPKVAMFCTGGIRCEKSTALLRMVGFDEVYHLRGGILKYLETVPEAHSRWRGECFVFDERVSVGHGLVPGAFESCRSCRRPLGETEKASSMYQPGVSCPACFGTTTAQRKHGFAERQRQVTLAASRAQAHVGATMSRPVPKRQPMVLQDPVGHLLELVSRVSGRRAIVGLAGLPGAGKSTLATRLALAVNQHTGRHCCLPLGMDGFHLTRSQLARFPDPQAALSRRGAPWTFDPAAMATAIRRLREAPILGSLPIVSWPGYEHGVGDPVKDAVQVAPTTQLVIVEGLYLLHHDHGWNLEGCFDEVWFLDTPGALCEQRLVERHMQSWGIDRAQALARVARNDRLNAEMVQATKPWADWLVQT